MLYDQLILNKTCLAAAEVEGIELEWSYLTTIRRQAPNERLGTKWNRITGLHIEMKKFLNEMREREREREVGGNS